MKKTYFNLALAASVIIISVFSSCRFGCIKGSGKQVTETRQISSFSALDISGGYKVVLKQDSSSNITITADDNLMKYIHTDLHGDVLKISSKKNLCSSGEMVLNIGIKQLRKLEASGAVDVSADGKLNVKDINFDLSGASKINLNLNASNVHTEGSGSTEIHLSGQATSHTINLTGSGKLYAFDFVVGDCNLETTGASECEINVLHQLSINTTGSADIKYKGTPSISEKRVGASTVTKVN